MAKMTKPKRRTVSSRKARAMLRKIYGVKTDKEVIDKALRIALSAARISGHARQTLH